MIGGSIKTAWLLGFISFLNETTSELLYPLIPIYLTTVVAFDPRLLGLIEGLALTATSLVKLAAGILADRTRTTKIWVIAGYFLAGLARPLYVLAHAWPVLFLLRLTERVGKGLRSAPRDAMLALSIPPERLGAAFGIHRAFDHAGAVAGPLLGALLLQLDAPLEAIFLWTAAPGALVLLMTLAVREPPREVHGLRFSWKLRGYGKAFRRYLVVQTLFTMGYPSNMFLLIRAEELGIPKFQLPLLWGLVALSSACFSVFFSGLSDRLGRQRLILAGWLIHAVFFLAMGLNLDRPWAWVLFPFFGLFLAATEGPQRAWVADLAQHRRLGAAYGWFNLTSGLTLLPASFLFGELWRELGERAAFGFAAFCSLSAALLLGRWVMPELKRQ